MALRRSTGIYPPNWKQISVAVKERHGWACIRCGHPHDPPAGYMLTVHHADLNPANCAWWNLLCLCQKCHLQIQHKVILERQWLWEHSEWFKPYAAGWYAHVQGLPEDEAYVRRNMAALLELGQQRLSLDDYLTRENASEQTEPAMGRELGITRSENWGDNDK